MNGNEPPVRIFAASRRSPAQLSATGQPPPPELFLAIELLSNMLPSADQIEDLREILALKVAALVPGVAAIGLDAVQTPGLPIFQVRVGVFSRPPNAAELAAAEDRLRTLVLVTLPLPTANLAIFVALPLMDRVADLKLPELQEEARKAGAEARPIAIDVRFDAGQHQLVTDVTLQRTAGVFDGPWVATLTDQPVRVDLGGIEVGGEPRHRFACGPALVKASGGLGRRKVEKELRERKTKGVLCGLLDQIQITTLLLSREAALPGNPHHTRPPAQAAELTFLDVDSAADGVRLSGGLELRNRQPEVGAIQPASALVLENVASHSLRLNATTSDLRAPLDFLWSLPGGGSFPNPTEARPTLVFNLTGSRPGDVFAREVKVRVSDADGLHDELTRTITVEILAKDQFPDEFGDGKPNVEQAVLM